MLLYLHVVAGAIGILAGFAALLFAKGSRRHRLSGDTYVVAMLVMTGSAFLATLFVKPNIVNTLAAMFTAYLVGTGWMSIHRRPEKPRALEFVATGVGAATALFAFGVVARADVGGMNGFGLVVGIIVSLCVLSDLRFWTSGVISRTQALVRHLWRMTFALAIASGSFFFGQMRHLPGWVIGSKLNLLLGLLPLALLVYWLIRVRRPPWSRKARAGDRSTMPHGIERL